MAIHLKTVFLTYLLSLMVLMQDVKPVLAKQGKGLKQRTKALETIVSELQKEMKELKECKACSKIKDLNEILSELQDKIDSKETWQKMNTEPVCFGTRDNQYGALRIPKGGRLKTIKLIYKSGGVHCNEEDDATYWGCGFEDYGNNGLLTVITTANNETVMPSAENLKSSTVCNKDFYSLGGTTSSSPELVFPDLAIPLSVSRDQELQIWYTQDMYDCSENNNSGKTCVDAYAWYA